LGTGIPSFTIGYAPFAWLVYVLDDSNGGCVSPEIETSPRDLEVLGSLGPEQLEKLRPHLIESEIARGRVVYFVGDSADRLYWVIRGAVRLYKSSTEGHITTLEVLGPGEAFGAISALDQDTYPASAEGVSEGTALSLPRAHFLQLLNDDPRIARVILEIITRRLHSAQERVRSFAQDPAPSRLAQALLRVAHDGLANVTRRDLAENAGTTVETAIRVLRNFQRDGIVHGSVGRIEIRDASKLERVAARQPVSNGKGTSPLAKKKRP
jgi:CRP-like cAMP-binding protein